MKPTKKMSDTQYILKRLDRIDDGIYGTDCSIEMLRGVVNQKEAAVCDLIAEFNLHARESRYKKTLYSLFYGFLFGTGMYVAVFALETIL